MRRRALTPWGLGQGPWIHRCVGAIQAEGLRQHPQRGIITVEGCSLLPPPAPRALLERAYHQACSWVEDKRAHGCYEDGEWEEELAALDARYREQLAAFPEGAE